MRHRQSIGEHIVPDLPIPTPIPIEIAPINWVGRLRFTTTLGSISCYASVLEHRAKLLFGRIPYSSGSGFLVWPMLLSPSSTFLPLSRPKGGITKAFHPSGRVRVTRTDSRYFKYLLFSIIYKILPDPTRPVRLELKYPLDPTALDSSGSENLLTRSAGPAMTPCAGPAMTP